MYTVESKSMLAKLLATENITVEHRSGAKTAKFNLQTRTLTCPIWRDMSGDLYDLLMGHEISHALRTPLEGWHDSVTYAGGNSKATPAEQKSFKHFLNVVEDARIEKLVKRQYPGLRNPMFMGYRDLLRRDFFGLSKVKNLNNLYLIDKLNLSAKVGVLLNVQFTTEEQPFYDEMMNLETFEDVLVLTKKLYAYSKIEQQKAKQEQKEKKPLKKEGNDKEEDKQEQGKREEGQEYDEDYEDGEQGEQSEEGEEGEESGSVSGEDDEEDGSEESDSDGESEGTDGDEEDESDSGAGKGAGDASDEDNSEDENGDTRGEGKGGNDKEKELDENFIPEAKTDETFRKREEKLLEEGEVNSIYINIPTPNLKDVVTPAVIVNCGLNQYYSTLGNRKVAHGLLTAFKTKNEDYVTLLAKEFEMKKAARSFSQARKAETGDININKLASYRTEDNIFRKLMIVKKGKSHGLVLMLDRSSSMQKHVEAATEQILIMALFCRKVNIPFVAYTFTDNCGASNQHDFGAKLNTLVPFSRNKDEFVASRIGFREILNSTMQASEFNHSMENQLLLAQELGMDGYGMRRKYVTTTIGYPNHEEMGSTPLNEAIVILRDVVKRFKMKHRLDIVNAIIVHDGDSDGNDTFHGGSVPYDPKDKHFLRVNADAKHRFDTKYDRVTIRDKKENVDFLCPRTERGLQTALLSWFQATTGCGVFGFYITGDAAHRKEALEKMYVDKLGVPLGALGRLSHADVDKALLLSQLQLKLTTEKFLESFSSGYSRFYFVPGEQELAADNGQLLNTAASGAWTPNRLLAAFKKASKKRVVSRVLVSRFIELIATR